MEASTKTTSSATSFKPCSHLETLFYTIAIGLAKSFKVAAKLYKYLITEVT